MNDSLGVKNTRIPLNIAELRGFVRRILERVASTHDVQLGGGIQIRPLC